MPKFSSTNQPAVRNNGPAVALSNKRRRIMTDVLLLALNEEVSSIAEGGKPTKRLRLIADQLVKKACEGDIQAIREVFDRVDGKAAQAIIHSGDEDRPITFNTYYEGKPVSN